MGHIRSPSVEQEPAREKSMPRASSRRSVWVMPDDRASSSEDVPDLGPPPARREIDVDIVRSLIGEQFPHWASLPISRVRPGGWDNVTFRLGGDLLVRMPSAAEYALAVEKEHQWLPVLAEHSPVPIPIPVGQGRPGHGYPFPWSIYTWLPGEGTDHEGTAAHDDLAVDLAEFLAAIRALDSSGGPQPGIHNWYRGATLRTYDAIARNALGDLRGHIDTALATSVWDAALAARWEDADVWFHGDLAPGNVLLDTRGRLAAVIDFGTCGVGDPSCDLAIAWTALNTNGRQKFREHLAIEDAEWARGRGWALWTSLRTLASSITHGNTADAASARCVINGLLKDFATSLR